MSSSRRPVPPVAWETGAALVVLGWRLAACPLERVWKDGIAILAVYWIFTALAGRTRAWKPVTLVTMLVLFAIYATAQVEYVLNTIRFTL